jgi:hypothetical protein
MTSDGWQTYEELADEHYVYITRILRVYCVYIREDSQTNHLWSVQLLSVSV